mgnify:CR=1 FL=1
MNVDWYKIILIMQRIKYGSNLQLKGIPVILRRGGHIEIGNKVTVRSSFFSNLIGLYSRTVIVARGSGAFVRIGDGVGISGATIYARKGIFIGNNTCIGGNCKILDNDFHPLDIKMRNEQLADFAHGGDSELIPAKEIWIGDNCFIGCNTIILKGTKLGDGCVVGAGAVVSGCFDSNCVIAGNPARIVRYLTKEENGKNA